MTYSRKPKPADLVLSDAEYQMLKRVSYLSPVKYSKRDIAWNIEHYGKPPEPGFSHVNSLDVKIGSDDHAQMEALLARNMVRFAGQSSKTALRYKQKGLEAEVGQWVHYWIGGGTFGHAAIAEYEQQNDLPDELCLRKKWWR